MTKRHLRRLLLVILFTVTPIILVAAGFGADVDSSYATGDNAPAPTSKTAAAVAQLTATPAAYPSPGGETEPTPTVEPAERTPTPEGGYPAGADIDGTGRVGGDDGTILGNESANDEANAATQTGPRIGQSALGSFILWLSFIFGIVVFTGGLFFSIFLSARDRHTAP